MAVYAFREPWHRRGLARKIAIPTISEAAGSANGSIDLNRGTAADLAELHGIGPVLAERFPARRKEHGPFETIEDLLDAGREKVGAVPAPARTVRECSQLAEGTRV